MMSVIKSIWLSSLASFVAVTVASMPAAVTFAEITPDAKDYPSAFPHTLKAGSLG